MHSDGFPENFDGVGIFAEIFPADPTSSTSAGIFAKSFSSLICVLRTLWMLVIESQISLYLRESDARCSAVLSFPICSLYSVASVAKSSYSPIPSCSFFTFGNAVSMSSPSPQLCAFQ